MSKETIQQKYKCNLEFSMQNILIRLCVMMILSFMALKLIIVFNINSITLLSRLRHKIGAKSFKSKKVTTNLTNPYFILVSFRTCFFSPFSSFNGKKIKLQVLQ